MRYIVPIWLMSILAVALTAVGCGERGGGAAGAGKGVGEKNVDGGAKIRVVATTGMIADVARNIAGERATVTALMGEGVDPHLYKPSPADVRLLTDADVVLYNGLHLEGRMGEVLENLGKGKGKTVVAVGEAIEHSKLRSPPEFEGQHDPHVWFDVSLWVEAAEAMREALIKADPAGTPNYRVNAEKYLAEMAALHEEVKAEIGKIPAERRVLITAHDAFGYFGRAYGMEVMAIQGISTDSEAGLKDINHLVDVIVQRKVPAVFFESSVPRKAIDALVEGAAARGHDVRIGGELFSDAMGADGTPAGTYLGMVRENVRVIVGGLGG
jgi:manganese/zinc/iron transport system substrate-binding protein